MTNEIWWQLGIFLSVLVIMMLIEWRMPARKAPIKSRKRWFANFGLVLASSIATRLAVPVGLTAVALYNQQHGIGLFNIINLPSIVVIVLSLILLDILIYWQHRLFHRIHHSQRVSETNSNDGFSVICWDWIFGSYKSEAKKSDNELDIGLKEYPSPEQNASLWELLAMPFRSNSFRKNE